jgi:hypothetical protein
MGDPDESPADILRHTDTRTWKKIVSATNGTEFPVPSSLTQDARPRVSIQQITDRLGPPSETQEYTIARAPTKQWNHAILFETYPKTDPENRDVRIKELTWKDGDYLIKACLHVIGDDWIVLGASRFHHGTRF